MRRICGSSSITNTVSGVGVATEPAVAAAFVIMAES
jgi:hypothetical protein